MVAKAMELSWVVVDDLKEAIQFYTEVLGLKLMEFNEHYGWAELQGKDGGARLGIGKKHEDFELNVGANAVVTFTVDNIETAIGSLQKGARCVGPIQEIPGQVKMQMFEYQGNHFQLCEMIK